MSGVLRALRIALGVATADEMRRSLRREVRRDNLREVLPIAFAARPRPTQVAPVVERER